MNRELWLLRHAKSDWSQTLVDFDRPLAKRGFKSVECMGQWLQQQQLWPEVIYSSTAKRAEQTITGIC